MKQGWKRVLMVALAVMLVLSVMPQVLAESENTVSEKYGKVTKDQVFLRKSPSTSADYWFRMDTNHVAEILDVVTQSGKTWYKVETGHPNDNGRTYTGYIMGDYFTPLTAEEEAAWKAGQAPGQPQPTATPVPPAATDTVTVTPGQSGGTTVVTYVGEITSGGTNFRVSPSTKGYVIMKLERGTVVELTSIPDTIDTDHWYGVRYAGLDGYVMSTFVRMLPDGSGNLTGGAVVHGYVKLIKSSANLRSAPDGTIVVDSGWKTQGEVLPYVSDPVSAGGYTWYEIVYGGVRYWVRGDCVQTVDSTGFPVTGGAVTNTAAPSNPGAAGYVVTTKAGVNLRLQPFGESIVQIKKGLVLPYTTKVDPYTAGNNSSYTWYYVTYDGVRGYVRSDCVEISTSSGTATNVPQAPAQPTAGTTVTGYGYVKMIKTGVNLRTKPGGSSLEQLALGTVVPVTGPTSSASSYTWYPVRAASGRTGVVRGDCVVVCDANGNPLSGGSSGSTGSETTAPSVTPTPTPSTSGYGYVQITLDRTNIRASINGSVIIQLPTKGSIFPLRGTQTTKNNQIWYPIIYNGRDAWVRGDCVKLVNADGGNASTATPPAATPTPSLQYSTYVITTADKVFLRASASKDSTAIDQVALGTVMAYSSTSGTGSNLWYKVIYNNKEVWVMGSYVRVMTQAEYDAWLAEHPNNEPSTSVIMGYVKTTAVNVNIRKTANGIYADRQVTVKGTVLPYTETKVVRNITWYYIETSDGFRGWITGEYAVETDKNGNTITPPTVTPGAGGSYTPPTAGQEASYTTLKYGSSGQAVTNLVTELKVQGYFTGAITSTYTREVEAAVKAFQKAKGLTVDGIAGTATQHALFQTVPIGQGSNVDFTFYPAEKIDWFTGGIQQLWPKGSNVKIYDVKTGIVWTAHRWSGGNHVDAEPLTAADTARLCKIYGVSTAKEIATKNLWEGRPSLVLIGTHNYACSVYGIPHGSDDVIANNNFDGMLCVHFTNSTGHSNGNQVSTNHANAIEYAYTHAPGGQK